MPGHPTTVNDSLVHDHAHFLNEDWGMAHTQHKQHNAQSMMLTTTRSIAAYSNQQEQQSHRQPLKTDVLLLLLLPHQHRKATMTTHKLCKLANTTPRMIMSRD